MKQKDLNRKIAIELDRFEKLWEAETWWAAVLVLSSIYNVICVSKNYVKLRRIWLPIILKPKIGNSVIEALKDSFIDRYKRIERIISIGDRFNDDELLLVLTYHTELSLVKDYLKEKNVNLPELDLKQIELNIKKIGGFKKNRKDFSLALSQLKTNWGLPIFSVWGTPG